MSADPLELTGSEGQPSLNTKPLFKLMVERKASDLFFTSNAPIKIKIEGQIYPINKQVLPPAAVRTICYGLMTPEQIVYFQREFEIDFAISEPGLGRFRVNIFLQRGYPAMVLRYITADMPRLDSLGLPETLTELAMVKRGEQLRVAMLTMSLLEEMREQRKLFVYHDADQSTLTEVRRLLAALNRYGANTLLWIVGPKPNARVGEVRWIEPGLIEGTVSGFQRPVNTIVPESVHRPSWLIVACAAYRLWRAGLPQR